MKQRILVAAALAALALVMLAACGGERGGEKVTVHVTDKAGGKAYPLSVAYQVGDGDWAWLRPDENASYSFYLPADEKRYGVAVRCPGDLAAYMGFKPLVIYQLNVADTKDPRFVCKGEPQTIRVNAAYDVSQPGGQSAYVYFDRGSVWLPGASGTQHFLSVFSAEKADFLLAAYSVGGPIVDASKLIAARLFADQPVSEGATVNLTLTAADAVGTKNVAAFSVPSGWNGEYSVGLSSPTGVRQPPFGRPLLGDGQPTGGTFKTVHGLVPGYFYVVYSQARKGGPGTDYDVYEARFVAPDAGTVSPTLPDPMPASAGPDLTGTAVALKLAYPDPDGYVLAVEQNDYALYIWASRAWLEGADAYTIPDFSEVAGMENFVIDPADTFGWQICAIKTGGDLGALLSRGYLDVERGLPLATEEALEWDLACASEWAP